MEGVGALGIVTPSLLDANDGPTHLFFLHMKAADPCNLGRQIRRPIVPGRWNIHVMLLDLL